MSNPTPEAVRAADKVKCPDCGGKRGRYYIETGSVNFMATRRSWLPCQTCNLAAYGLEVAP